MKNILLVSRHGKFRKWLPQCHCGLADLLFPGGNRAGGGVWPQLIKLNLSARDRREAIGFLIEVLAEANVRRRKNISPHIILGRGNFFFCRIR